MPAAEDAAALLVSQAIATVSEVFHGDFPDGQPDRCIAVVPARGGKPGKKFGQSSVGFDYGRVRVKIRGPVQDYDNARALAYAAHALFVEVQAELVNGTFYHTMLPADTPGYVGEDDNRRPIFEFFLQPEREP